MERAERLLHCKITVEADGTAHAKYRWANLERDGGQSHDEDVSTWEDDEIIDCFAELIGASEEDKAVMEVERE